MPQSPVHVDLTPDPQNANAGTQRGLGMVERSLRQYGAGRSILASNDGIILAGNKTYERAQELGIPVQEIESDGTTLFVIRRTDLAYDDPRAKELAIADNRASETGLEWDADMLASLADEGVDLDQFWFEDELADLLGGTGGTDGMTDPDAVPDPPDDPITKPGDVWLLGEHRVMCGDSTVVTDVDRLMAGRKADMVFTDPPYNVDIAGGTHDPRDQKNYGKGPRIANDVMTDDAFDDFLLSAFSSAYAAMNPGAAYYVCSPAGRTETQFRNALDSVFTLRQCIVWVKQQFVFGRQDYHWRHESILYGWKDGAAHYFIDDKTQDTVWELDRPMRSEKDHPTQKPPALPAVAINNSSKPGGLVLDLFGGSGSTLIACEQTGRTAYLMELDPKYVDVIRQRWEAFTGQSATREQASEAAVS